MKKSSGVVPIPLPQGFFASGVHCGVRQYRPDLGLIMSEAPCVAAGVFTQNTFRAAPVKYSQSLLPADNIRALITNSGQANAGTGEQGDQDNAAMVAALAQALTCHPQQVLSASTGVIGEPLALEKITKAMPALIDKASTTADSFAKAILTTDLVPKMVSHQLELAKGTVTITGICKGSGMIHPNMATMLGYLLCDVRLNKNQAHQYLQQAVAESFNMISVDGETSTNDAVFFLANGASGVTLEDEDIPRFVTALTEVAVVLAKSIARDGEGATTLIEVSVRGAPEIAFAKHLARWLTTSPLIKTAIYGNSPNWGRIIARLGELPLPEAMLATCVLTIQGQRIYAEGRPQVVDKEALKKAMKSHTVYMEVDLNQGAHQATAWGCDLTEGYIKINAEYVT